MRICTVLACLVVVLYINEVRCYTCDSNPYVNGCSIPGNLTYFYKEVFRSDCNKHDVCYACGQRFGVSRRSCDRTFNANIRQTCETDRSVRNEVWCLMVTHDYYAAVRIFGRSRYRSEALSWCGESWVTPCI